MNYLDNEDSEKLQPMVEPIRRSSVGSTPFYPSEKRIKENLSKKSIKTRKYRRCSRGRRRNKGTHRCRKN